MRFVDAIDRFVEDMRMQGRINSDRTEERYRRTLELHNDDVNGRDPHHRPRRRQAHAAPLAASQHAAP
jgi:hypothetical protein